MNPAGVIFVTVVLGAFGGLVLYTFRVHRRNWGALAERLGGQLELKTGFLKAHYSVEASQNGLGVRVEGQIELGYRPRWRRNRRTGPDFEATAQVDPPSDLSFTVRVAAFSGGGKKRGVQLHDDEFDAIFVVESSDEMRLRAFLTSERRRQIAGALKGLFVYDGSVTSEGQVVSVKRQGLPKKDKLNEAVDLAVSFAKALAADS